MKSLDGEMDVLSEELDRLDYVVVKHGGATPVTLCVGFLGIVALIHDACRFVLTEGCLTRLQQLIASRTTGRSRLFSGARPMLAESAQYTFLDQRAADTTFVR